MLRFFPFGESFDARMGGRLLPAGEPLFDIDPPKYTQEVSLKRRLLDGSPAYYFRGGGATLEAQWEVLALILEDLAAVDPAHFHLKTNGADWRWSNRVLGEDYAIRFGDADSLPCEPLDWAGRQIQEDLVLVGADEQHRIVGGQLCFANSWSLPSHLGKAFFEIHVPTPQTTLPAVQAGQRLLDGLKPGKTIWRMNWNFKLSGELDLSTREQPRYLAQAAERTARLTTESVGEEIFVRVERQTLTRLPRSSAVLFGIHTYISRLADEAADPQRALSILKVIRDAPPDVKAYKAIGEIEPRLSAYLASRL